MVSIPKGSTLTKLADQYGTTVDDLMKANAGNPSVKSRDLILAGGDLKLPGAGRSLEGTLPSEERTLQPAGAEERTLPTSTSGVANFKAGLNLIDNHFRAKQESPQDIIAKLGTQLGEIINPDVMTGVLGDYTALRQESTAGIFKSAMDTISEQQTNQQNYMQTVLGKLDFVPTVKEYQELLGGNPSEEFMAKINESEERQRTTEIKPPSISEQLSAREAGFDIVDGKIQQITGKDPITGVATDPSKVIQGYDFTSYATDPNWGNSINNKLAQIGKFNSTGDIDSYIKSNYPSSKITGEMVANTSEQYGLSWEMITAITGHESLMGTSNVAMKNNNPAGVTWNNNFPESMKGTARPSAEGGNYVKFATMQDGLDFLGSNMAKRKIAEPDAVAEDKEIRDLVELVNTGAITASKALDEVTPSKKNALLESLATTPKKTDLSSIVAAKDQLAKIHDIQNSSALNEAVGPNFLAADFGSWDIAAFSGAKQTFIGSVSNLVDQLTLDKLIESKAQGATFGALSETELKMLANAATKINNWARFRRDGTVKGYSISEKAFNAELEQIKILYTRAIERKTNSGVRTMDDGSVWTLNQDGNYEQI